MNAASGTLTAFRTVVLDVDSTLTAIEGIDWLAARRSPAVAAEVARLTERAMDGEVALDEIYGMRLALVAPTRNEVIDLGRAYIEQLAPGAAEAISAMKRAQVDVHLVSGGLLPAVQALGKAVGIRPDNIHAVPMEFDGEGRYTSFDSGCQLTKENGKRALVTSLHLAPPVLMIGDGITDAEVKPAVDAFAAYIGFVRRKAAVDAADFTVESFEEVLKVAMK